MKLNNLLFVLLAVLMMHCNQKGKHPMQGASPEEIREQLLESSKSNAQQEDQQIERFIDANKLEMTKTGTGLRYLITKKDTVGAPLVKLEQRVLVNYRVSLLNGKSCYSSKDNGGPREFTVGRDDVESGLHEGIQLLRKGEHAIFIMPSHMAHGFTGDQQCIPGNSPIVYDIEVLYVR
jgi:FKBP-type peptidyl-prolyl cis-trans isomerase FkpA